MYGFLFQGKNGLKTVYDNKPAYPDRSWKNPRVGVVKNIEEKRTLSRPNGDYCFITGEMLESEEITKADVTDALLNAISTPYENEKCMVAVQEGKNGFIVLMHSFDLDIYVKLNGILVMLAVPLNHGMITLLQHTYDFKLPYYYLDSFSLDTKEEQMEAVVKVYSHVRNNTFCTEEFTINIIDNRFIRVDKDGYHSCYIYSKVSLIVQEVARRYVPVTDDSVINFYSFKEITDYIRDNGIVCSDTSLTGSSTTNNILHEFTIRTKSGNNFGKYTGLGVAGFRSGVLENKNLVSIVQKSLNEYKADVNRCKKQLTVRNLDEFKKCLSIDNVLGCTIAD